MSQELESGTPNEPVESPAAPAPAKKRKPNPKLPRQEPARQDPLARQQNFNEVSLGITEEQALLEANRCLDCKDPKCIAGCPVGIDIPAFLRLVLEKDFLAAAEKIWERNLLPAICGRVCQQENYCEATCLVGKKLQPIAIGQLERFVADYVRAMYGSQRSVVAPPTGKRVALVGSGPASLTAASDLARQGHDVTVFEALHELGGVLTYGIPEFRLPREVLRAEIEQIREIGVKFVLNFIVGKTRTIDELLEEFDAIFIGSGAGTPHFMNVPGENLLGVYSANEFLTRVNLMRAYRFPEYDTPIEVGRRVAVIGGGNSAMDAARVALRLGPEKVMIVYRRSRTELPARLEEIHHAAEEGVEFIFLAAPVLLEGDAKAHVRRMQSIRMELGEPDASGRRRPVPIAGSEFWLEVDTVIVAVGASSNPIIQMTTPGLDVTKRGTIRSDESGATSRPGVFAGGDIVRGGATVLLAMMDGRRAAEAIHRYLMGEQAAEAKAQV